MELVKEEKLAAAGPTPKVDYFPYIPPVFITLILLIGQLTFGILDNYINVVVAIVTSITAEIVLARLILGTRKNLASAYITGISVGILVRTNMVWPYVVASLISILSKYVIRYKGRHLWNPSNLGVSWLLLMAPLSVAGLGIQWGNNLWPMLVIWLLGFGIVYRAKKLHVTLTYIASFVILAYVRSLISHDPFLAELAPLTGPMYQLFIFFMITDPGVAVSTKRAQVIVVILVAIVEFVLRLENVIYAPFYALSLIGPIARYLDLRYSAQKSVAK